MSLDPKNITFEPFYPQKALNARFYSTFLVVIYGVFSSLFIVFFGVLDNILDNFDTFFTKGATLTIKSLQK